MRIVFEDGLETLAGELAKRVGGDAVKVENALDAPTILEETDELVLLYFKTGKDISDKMVALLKEGFGSIDLSGLEYLASICVCEKPQYALTVVDRLCARIGCLPSYSTALNANCVNDCALLDTLCKDLASGAVKIAKGGLLARLHMKRFIRERFK